MGFVATPLGLGCSHQKTESAADQALEPPRQVSVLVFTATQGFRHPSIEAAHRVLSALPDSAHLNVSLTEDPAAFTDSALSAFDVVAFVNTTGDVLNGSQEAAMQRFIRSGKGYVGVHAAADTEHDWNWYGELVGAYFRSHPLLPLTATVTTEDAHHRSVAHLSPTFEFTDEWYNFDRNPRNGHNILLTVDESQFNMVNTDGGPSMGDDHPVAWEKEFDGGRSWYTNLGHRPETWDDPRFITHLVEGIRWAAEPIRYSRQVVAPAKNPMKLAVVPDGRVLFIERTGEVRLFSPKTGRTVTAGVLPVDTDGEGGMLGVLVDPKFQQNKAVYFYFSEAGKQANVLARFVLEGDRVDMGSRRDLRHIPAERACCHEGGAMAFLPDGTLLLSTGDNTNPHKSGGYSPLDEREGKEGENAQRTAGNPFSLRGKILRIRTDGTIPEGNLYPGGVDGAREVYVTGTRNPFTMAVDAKTGRVFWGDVGPDAGEDSERGPRGYDEINLADSPGHYGWPFCVADNRAYSRYNFETGALGAPFECEGMRGSILQYDYATKDYLALGNAVSTDGSPIASGLQFTGRTVIAGVYYRALPGAPFTQESRFLDTLIMADWTRDVVASVSVNDAGQVTDVTRMFPFMRFRRPIDMAVAPDGALYVLEFGTEFFGDNSDAGLSRIEYSAAGTLSPTSVIDATETAGLPPHSVTFDGAKSRAGGRADPIVSYEWDVDADGQVDATSAVYEHTFRSPGAFDPSLTVVTASGRRSVPKVLRVVVGNTRPVVTIESPKSGVSVPVGAHVLLRGRAEDVEDGDAACDELEWDVRTGHNAHSHPLRTLRGCEVDLTALLMDHATETGRLFYAVELSYADHGAAGFPSVPSLTGRAQIEINVAPF